MLRVSEPRVSLQVRKALQTPELGRWRAKNSIVSIYHKFAICIQFWIDVPEAKFFGFGLFDDVSAQSPPNGRTGAEKRLELTPP